MKIDELIGISGATLVVYRVNGCYQYAIAFWDGSIYQPQEIYDTAVKALDIGLESIKTVISY